MPRCLFSRDSLFAEALMLAIGAAVWPNSDRY